MGWYNGKNLKWNKQRNLDDKNQKTTHNIEFKKQQIHPAATVHYFWNVVKEKMGIDEKSNFSKNWEKSKSNNSG